jgi:hypothetical protein
MAPWGARGARLSHAPAILSGPVYCLAMAITEAQVETVVRDTEARMQDPGFAQLAVAAFVQSQPILSQYLATRAARLGGEGSVLHLIFHAHVVSECFREGLGRDPGEVDIVTLDRASEGDLLVRLSEREPAMASFVVSNTESAELREELARVGLAFSLLGARRGLRH